MESPLETRVIQIGRVPVRYSVAGIGSPLVLIHGLASFWRWWRPNRALGDRHTLFLIDRRKPASPRPVLRFLAGEAVGK